jgi:alpha-glucuronidase
MEFQVAQEYLGQGNHLVYLAPMWKEILDFDTQSEGAGSTVGKYLEKQPVSGITAVSNTGDNPDWCGSLFHPANWYAFGRLCWDWTLDSETIAREWAAMTWGTDPAALEGVLNILMHSWDACVDYMTPLGLHHIMRYHHHYGPDPACDEGAREDWKPRYYHRADKAGLGFDRTRNGSNAVDQYAKPAADIFNDIKTCPEKYLLWFHHVPWNYTLSSGRSLKDEIVYRYDRGVAEAEQLRAWWKTLEGKVAPECYAAVLAKLDIQVADAHEWRDVCVPYFAGFWQ